MISQWRKFTSYANRPKCFFDIETSGTDPNVHEITELAFIHEKLGPWSVRIKIKYPDRFNEESRRISRYSEHDWEDAVSFKRAAPQITKFLEDCILIGHNLIGFDMPFVYREFERNKLDSSPISRAIVDTQVLALQFLVPQGLKRIGLKPCCDFFNISSEGAHAAYEDVERTKQVYEKIVSHLRWDDGKAKQQSLF